MNKCSIIIITAINYKNSEEVEFISIFYMFHYDRSLNSFVVFNTLITQYILP